MLQFKNLLLTSLLAMTSAAGAWAQVTAEKPTGNGSVASPYLLTTPAHMQWLKENFSSSEQIDGQYPFEANYALGADIDLSTVCSETIGSWKALHGTSIESYPMYFNGTFDGRGHTISHLYINSAVKNLNYVGFFYALGSGTVKDLTFADVDIRGGYYVGAVAGMGDNHHRYTFTISDVRVTGNINTSGYDVGGFVGSLGDGTFIRCVNEANITCTNSSNATAGGIIGKQVDQQAIFDRCINRGTITSPYQGNVGGIAGTAFIAEISNCLNTGDITSGTNSGIYSVGGIVGEFCSSSEAHSITGCLSTGNITGYNYTGYIVGGTRGTATVTGCFYDSSKTLNRGNGLNKGTVYGYNGSGSISLNDCLGLTSEQIASGFAAFMLQGTQTGTQWGQKIGTDACPEPRTTDRVYLASGSIDCGGTEHTTSYSNSPSALTADAHDWHDGYCPVCGTVTAPVMQDGYYRIASLGNLLWLRDEVNVNHVNRIKARQTADIDLSPYCGEGKANWTPIGNSNYPDVGMCYFQEGEYDGQDHTISGLYYHDDTQRDFVGLFGYNYNSSIHNLHLTGVDINAPQSNQVGAAMGYSIYSKAKVQNVTVEGNIAGKNYVGGLVGTTASGASIADGSFHGSVNASFTAGGITGQFSGACNIADCVTLAGTTVTSSGNYAGGIAGQTYNGGPTDITNCVNRANVTADRYAAGVVAYCSNRVNITGCTNYGNIHVTGNEYAGGIVGNIYQCSGSVISDCTNSGAITSNLEGTASYIGGIAGQVDATNINHCYNTGTVEGKNSVGGIAGYIRSYSSVNPTISFCENTADFRCDDKQFTRTGGIVGYASAGLISDCRNRGNIDGTCFNNVGGILGNVSSTLPQLAYCLNEGNVKAGDVDCGLIYGGGSRISITACYAKASAICGRYTNNGFVDNAADKRLYTWAQATPNAGSVIADDATDDDYTSGRLAFELQGNRTDNTYWSQDLAAHQAEPQLGGTARVYLNGTLNCAGGIISGSYTNTETTPTQQAHTFDTNDVCTACLKGNEPAEVDGVRQIATVGNLVWLSQQTAAGRNTLDADLTADLNIAAFCTAQGETGWQPIGTETNRYEGHFDGHHHTISGLSVKRTNLYVGLFGRFAQGSISDVNVEGTVKGSQFTALLCGSNEGGTISGCSTRGTVSGSYYVGGIVGSAGGGSVGSVVNCVNHANASAQYRVAGIAGTATCLVTDCTNHGTITATTNGYAYAGGIAGDYGYTQKLTRCANYGSVTTQEGMYAGGICGSQSNTNVNSGISYCANYADITANSRVGGICGYSQGNVIDHCFTSGNIASQYSTGSFMAVGFFNTASTAKTEAIYYDSSKTLTVGGSAVEPADDFALPATAAEIAAGRTAALLGLPFGQQLTGPEANAYPVIGGPQVWYGQYLVHADEEPAYATPRASNTEHLMEAYEPHNIVGGVCTICHRHDGEKIDLTPNANLDDWTSDNQRQDNSTSTHVWTLTGAIAGNTITFDWRVSSESNYDKLTVTITHPDGTTIETLVNAVSGNRNGSETYTFPADGTYTLTASYTKDGTTYSGDDTAWLTNVVGPGTGIAGINADFNNDTLTDINDLNLLRSVITRYTKPDDAHYDLNGDGRITISDLNILIKNLLP